MVKSNQIACIGSSPGILISDFLGLFMAMKNTKPFEIMTYPKDMLLGLATSLIYFSPCLYLLLPFFLFLSHSVLTFQYMVQRSINS